MKTASLIKPLQPGAYVIAVSGGVDSMALLDMLQKQSGLNLVVAHVDHGMRDNSRRDREFVENIAASHNLSFEYTALHLGENTGETPARIARYNFLRRVCIKYNIPNLVLAHHQDDVLETAFINLIRGTGRKGLHSLQSHTNLLRPLLHVSKKEILTYAQQQGLKWRNDESNFNQKYLRNMVRLEVITKMSRNQKKELLNIIVRQKKLNKAIEGELQKWLTAYSTSEKQSVALPRYQLIMLSPDVAREILQRIFVRLLGKTVERPVVDRALLFAKTAKPGKYFILNNQWRLQAAKGDIIVAPRPGVVS